jgi:hypothetical protein
VAQASRRDHPEPPDGPKALDRAMQRAAQRLKQTGAPVSRERVGEGQRRRHPRGASARMGPKAQRIDELAAYYADLVNSDRFLPRAHQQHHPRCDAGARAGHAGAAARAGGAMSSTDRRPAACPRPAPGRGGKVKRALGVQAALEWAFRVEKAQLELPERPDPERGQGFGFGLEYVLLQRAALGCKIDGGQHKIGGYTHEDAEVIAATVAGMPDSSAASAWRSAWRNSPAPG